MHGYIVGDAFWSHNQNKGHVFEDDENKETIVAQSKQRVKGISASCTPIDTQYSNYY